MLDLSHKHSKIWKDSLVMVKTVYKITEHFPRREYFILIPQIKRAALSVLLNISEGLARKSNKEKIRFLEIARGSIVELDAQIEISNELGYLNSEDVEILDDYLNNLFAQLSSLKKFIEKQII
jgi:four helix bundle protein